LKLLVFTATYNEKDNVIPLIHGVWQVVPEADLLIIDDASPDGTGRLLDMESSKNSKLKVIHRPGKLGVGSAHKIALQYALDQNYDKLVTMDADFSHEPSVIREMNTRLDEYEFVIGSRFVNGGRVDYVGFRRFISLGANWMARYLLGIKLHETTTSFRGFRRSLLQKLPIKTIEAEGYSFFLECSYFICLTTKNFFEIPIHFKDRQFGQSKISKHEILMGFLTVFRLFFYRVLRVVGR
jgi:dolichol-phosphate mannosyltransferase